MKRAVLAISFMLALIGQAPAQEKQERAQEGVDEVKVGRELTNLDRQKERFKEKLEYYKRFGDIILKNQITKKQDPAAYKKDILKNISLVRASLDAIKKQKEENKDASISFSALGAQLADLAKNFSDDPFRSSLLTTSSEIEKAFGEKLEGISNFEVRQDLGGITAEINEKALPRFDKCRAIFDGFGVPSEILRLSGPLAGILERAFTRNATLPNLMETGLNTCEKAINDEYDPYFARLSDEYNSFVDSILKRIKDRTAAIGTEDAKVDTQIASLEKQLREDRTRRQELERIRAETEAQKARAVIDSASKETILLTLIAWGAIICVVVGAIVLLARYQAINPERKDFSYPIFLEMITVFVLTASILILGLATRLNSEALAALIGGVSGYVLGKFKEAAKNP
jgi:hypothetical protein